MSRNFAVLGKSGAVPLPSPAAQAPPDFPAPAPAPAYQALVRRLFHGRSVVAVIGIGFDGVPGVCDDIAAELASSGKRVVVVSVERLLSASQAPVAAETAIVPGPVRNVWHWPGPPSPQIEFFRSSESHTPGPPATVDPAQWLEYLRQNFDSVLFSCPALSPERPDAAESGIVGIASRADAAVLVVEAGRTPKHQIQRDQRALQSRGVRLAGCVLVRGR